MFNYWFSDHDRFLNFLKNWLLSWFFSNQTNFKLGCFLFNLFKFNFFFLGLFVMLYRLWMLNYNFSFYFFVLLRWLLMVNWGSFFLWWICFNNISNHFRLLLIMDLIVLSLWLLIMFDFDMLLLNNWFLFWLLYFNMLFDVLNWLSDFILFCNFVTSVNWRASQRSLFVLLRSLFSFLFNMLHLFNSMFFVLFGFNNETCSTLRFDFLDNIYLVDKIVFWVLNLMLGNFSFFNLMLLFMMDLLVNNLGAVVDGIFLMDFLVLRLFL